MGGSNFTVEGLTTDTNDEGETVVTSDEGTMTFASDGSLVFASNDPDADVLTMMNPVYNYTAEGDDVEGFFITGDTEECADFVYAFNADGLAVGSEDCDFLIVMTDDFFAVGNEDAFVTFMEDSVMFGSTVTGSNFTLEGVTTEVNDDGDTVLTTDDGTMTFTADGSVAFAFNDPDADVLTMMNPVYNYTEEGEGGLTITGDTEECADFFLAFNTDGAMVASEDCGFLAAVDGDVGLLLTDDSFTVGSEDAYVSFTEDSVMFGSTVTGSNFTVDVDVTETDDEGIMMTYDEGSTTFTAGDTVVLASSDPDADTLTINNPVYNYTDDAFIISGDIEGCDDLFLAAMKMVGFMLQMIRLQLAMMRVLPKSYSTLATMTVPVKRSRNYCVTVQLLIVILLCANCGQIVKQSRPAKVFL